jgi:predicted amidohydrolase YtcJ
MPVRSTHSRPKCFVLFRWASLVAGFLAIGLDDSSPAQAQLADTVLTGGTIRTMDTGQPVVEALAIRGDEILATGTLLQLESLVGPETKIIRLEPGQLAIPGLIESHAHFLGLGESLMMLDLAGAQTWEEIVEQVRVAAAAAPPGSWIVGRGWHQSKWQSPPAGSTDGYPDNQSLDSAAPHNPVLLTHASGHMSIANGYALNAAGLDENSQPPAGGEFLRRADGTVSGVLRETAQGPVHQAYARDQARLSDAEKSGRLATAIRLAGEECWRNGITSFHDAGSSLESVAHLRAFAIAGQLPVRLYVMVRDDVRTIEARMSALRSVGLGNEFLTVRALKRSIDGALGPHGAWLLAPYADHPSAGLNTDSVELVRATAEIARKLDLQMCVHAIGDRANREVLDLYAELLGERGARRDHRWRIEHAQHLHPDDIGRFAELGVVAAMQGVHCTSDAIFVPQRLGELRSRVGAYVWRSLLDSGAVICNGTDAPVERIDPVASLVASVARRLPDGSQFYPEQCMTREEALRSYTLDAAWAAFEETRKGSLVPGKLADITVLSGDFMTADEASLSKTRIVRTIIGGVTVWENEAAALSH